MSIVPLSKTSSSDEFTRLKEAWLQEQFSPDILPYETSLVSSSFVFSNHWLSL